MERFTALFEVQAPDGEPKELKFYYPQYIIPAIQDYVIHKRRPTLAQMQAMEDEDIWWKHDLDLAIEQFYRLWWYHVKMKYDNPPASVPVYR